MISIGLLSEALKGDNTGWWRRQTLSRVTRFVLNLSQTVCNSAEFHLLMYKGNIVLQCQKGTMKGYEFKG